MPLYHDFTNALCASSLDRLGGRGRRQPVGHTLAPDHTARPVGCEQLRGWPTHDLCRDELTKQRSECDAAVADRDVERTTRAADLGSVALSCQK